MADAESADGGERPSFTTFWKRVKQKEKSEAGDQHKKKGKKSASPSSTAELQQDEAGEEDQDPGEFPRWRVAPFVVPVYAAYDLCLSWSIESRNDSIFACPKTGKTRARGREGSWTAERTRIGHVHSNTSGIRGAIQ